jgi:hypothetical protein
MRPRLSLRSEWCWRSSNRPAAFESPVIPKSVLLERWRWGRVNRSASGFPKSACRETKTASSSPRRGAARASTFVSASRRLLPRAAVRSGCGRLRERARRDERSRPGSLVRCYAGLPGRVPPVEANRHEPKSPSLSGPFFISMTSLVIVQPERHRRPHLITQSRNVFTPL